MNVKEAREWLDVLWSEVLTSGSNKPDAEVDRLVSSKVVSIRYAVLTQLLGKVADPTRSLLFFQLGEKEVGAWDARSFCASVIVPWVSDNHDVLGTSAEPYASKPLRRKRLERDAPNIRDKTEWAALYDFFAPLDRASDDKLEKAVRRCLGSVARRLSLQSFKYQIPIRVSLPNLCNAVESFLSKPSGGSRTLSVVAAMMQVLGDGLSIFTRVESQGINEADAASGAPGDIMCYDETDNMVLAVEVKDRDLTLSDVRSSTRKVRESDDTLSNLLFATPGIRDQESSKIHESMTAAWASGLNIYQVDIIDLTKYIFVLLPEEWRPVFLRQIGKELDRRGDHEHRHAWHRLLSALGEQTV